MMRFMKNVFETWRAALVADKFYQLLKEEVYLLTPDCSAIHLL